ncbi:LOW QUALITY PROTEIN: deleted in lung and esophageal cancer protein 1 [Perognathus longimembris pacificus]|uniref:LOW QUALITY PROTEIN: deleted in lung and esophageal cancer protein 1 n=1 Tax=Perognathus longimembris pacificus TaxID=214514 RepID=UPI0020198280|nr:LOW QUALITY PROTEIN: deleted in lung and esophageal cancer protein 1 [Perognathus longimembris pacificus]
MEPAEAGSAQEPESQVYDYVDTLSSSPSPRKSSLPSTTYSVAYQQGLLARPRRLGLLSLSPAPEPQMLRLRPASRRSQDVSHLLTCVFRNLYSVPVIGEDLGASLVRARGSRDSRLQQFVEQLQQVQELYKQRLDEVEMLERHIIQARARALAETERATNQARVHFLEPLVKLPPVKSIFRWCVDSSLLRKHNLICPEDYYTDPVPFCSAPKGNFYPLCSKLKFSCQKLSKPKRKREKEPESSSQEKKVLLSIEEESDHTMESSVRASTPKAKLRENKESPKKTGLPKNKKWMNHLSMSQRKLERCLLASMETRNHFLRNPRFFPPNTPQGGKSLIFPPKTCADTPVFLAKPSVVFFTDYEIGPVYEMTIALQNTTSASRYLRVLPPCTPYFALGLGMFPGKGGMVAPGMTCQYVVQFIPDCLGDFDDFILVETQSAHTLVIPLQARRPPPVLTLSPVLDCGYCLIGGIKMTRFVCKNVGFSLGKFCIMPKRSWPPPCFRAVAISGFVEQPPFGVMPSVFELAPGFAILLEVLFLPTALGKVEQTYLVVCDNCQVKELVIKGTGQLVALDLIYVSGEKSEPEPGELMDLTAQHFIRFEPENPQTTAKKLLIIRNATHVELAFHWQIMKPNLKPLMPGETYSMENIKCHPDKETAFSIMPEKGNLSPHSDHEFILSFSPYELRLYHSVLQMVLEDIPEPLSSEDTESLEDRPHCVDNVIVLEIEAKGQAEPFQVLLDPYALILPGESYIGMTVKKAFKMWNNSKSHIRYLWGKISDCHIIEVEPCCGIIESNEVGEFQLNLTGGTPGPLSKDLMCKIKDSPTPVVLHIEAAFKGPSLVINVSAVQFGLLRLGQRAVSTVQIQNVSQLPAVWHLRESQVLLEERLEEVSPLAIEPSSGQLPPLGECSVAIRLDTLRSQRLQTVLELEVENGACSYLPVYAEVQAPHVYLKHSHVEVANLYLGVPTKTPILLINGTLLPTRFHWGKLLGNQAALCSASVTPRRGMLSPSEERQLSFEFTAYTQEELVDLALPCHVSSMKKLLVLGISGKPRGLEVTMTISMEDPETRAKPSPAPPEELYLDFGSTVPLRTHVHGYLILTNHCPIRTPFILNFENFGSPEDSLSRKAPLPDMSPALLTTPRIQEGLAKREMLVFMENMLSHGKGAAFFPHTSQGMLGAYQQLRIKITACASMWGEYWDNLTCMVGDLPPTIIPVHMAVVGCPISSMRTSYYTLGHFQKEPIIRFGTQVSGGKTITRTIRLNNSSPCDIRLDWETYLPEHSREHLLELLVFYGPRFPLLDAMGNELVRSESSEASCAWPSSSPSDLSESSHAASLSVEGSSSAPARAMEPIISVILKDHEGVPTDQVYSIWPRQVVVPAGGRSTIHVSFTPMRLGPDEEYKVECTGYALGFMSLDNEVDRELPGRVRRLQDFDVDPLRLEMHGSVRRAQLSIKLDSSGHLEFRCQASDLIPKEACAGVLSELLSTRHLRLINTTDIPQHFRILVSSPFTISQDKAHAGLGGGRASGRRPLAGKLLALPAQENMEVSVSFRLSLELLSYQRLPADQMLPGVDIIQRPNGEKEMVFTQNLLLEFTNETTQMVPLRATVAVPELQLSTSWVDFGTCFVNQRREREFHLLNRSACPSYWAVMMGQKEARKEAEVFAVSPSSGRLEARPVNAPPTSVTLQVFFTARDSELYESTLVVDGLLGEKACTLRLRGQGSYDEKYMAPPF